MNLARKQVREQKLHSTDKASALATAGLCLFLLAIAFTNSSCSGSGGPVPAQSDPQAACNWQFSMTPTAGTSFAASPLQGGFLLQQN